MKCRIRINSTSGDFLELNDLDLANISFIESKGFDVSTVSGLTKAKTWLETTDPDNLMYGDPTGDPFDIQMGSMRRGMLIEAVEKKLKRLQTS